MKKDMFTHRYRYLCQKLLTDGSKERMISSISSQPIDVLALYNKELCFDLRSLNKEYNRTDIALFYRDDTRSNVNLLNLIDNFNYAFKGNAAIYEINLSENQLNNVIDELEIFNNKEKTVKFGINFLELVNCNESNRFCDYVQIDFEKTYNELIKDNVYNISFKLVCDDVELLQKFPFLMFVMQYNLANVKQEFKKALENEDVNSVVNVKYISTYMNKVYCKQSDIPNTEFMNEISINQRCADFLDLKYRTLTDISIISSFKERNVESVTCTAKHPLHLFNVDKSLFLNKLEKYAKRKEEILSEWVELQHKLNADDNFKMNITIDFNNFIIYVRTRENNKKQLQFILYEKVNNK